MVAGYVATLYSRRLKRSQGVSDRLPVDRRAKESLLVVDGVFGRRQECRDSVAQRSLHVR